MDVLGRTENRNKKTATDELGHALGLGDHYENIYSTIIMYGIMYAYASSETTPKAHDIQDYRTKIHNKE